MAVPTELSTAPRRSHSEPVRKPGWQVLTSVADAVREAVSEGAASSQNAFVEQALVRELAEVRRQKLYASYAEAARDPAFLKDMQDTADAFEATVADGLTE